jgi:hypothetical protein
MDVDMSFLSMGKMLVSCILVSLNIRRGLVEEIKLSWGEKSYMQKLDYEGIPFRCRRCHKHGHIASECQLLMCIVKGKNQTSTSTEKEGASQIEESSSTPSLKQGRALSYSEECSNSEIRDGKHKLVWYPLLFQISFDFDRGISEQAVDFSNGYFNRASSLISVCRPCSLPSLNYLFQFIFFG